MVNNNGEAIIRLTPLAKNTHHPQWDWNGKTYPKTKRSNGPNRDSLEYHSPVLTVLLELAPNGYPDAYVLRDVFVKLHELFRILEKNDPSEDAQLSITGRATFAADRWRIMTKHCLILKTSRAEIPTPGLKLVVSLIQSRTPMADTAAATVATLQAGGLVRSAVDQPPPVLPSCG